MDRLISAGRYSVNIIRRMFWVTKKNNSMSILRWVFWPSFYRVFTGRLSGDHTLFGHNGLRTPSVVCWARALLGAMRITVIHCDLPQGDDELKLSQWADPHTNWSPQRVTTGDYSSLSTHHLQFIWRWTIRTDRLSIQSSRRESEQNEQKFQSSSSIDRSESLNCRLVCSLCFLFSPSLANH